MLRSIWLKDSEGLSEYNLRLLAVLISVVSEFRRPWVLGGDWNMSPEQLTTSGALEILGGTVVAPELPTCNGKIYDCLWSARG